MAQVGVPGPPWPVPDNCGLPGALQCRPLLLHVSQPRPADQHGGQWLAQVMMIMMWTMPSKYLSSLWQWHSAFKSPNVTVPNFLDEDEVRASCIYKSFCEILNYKRLCPCVSLSRPVLSFDHFWFKYPQPVQWTLIKYLNTPSQGSGIDLYI